MKIIIDIDKDILKKEGKDALAKFYKHLREHVPEIKEDEPIHPRNVYVSEDIYTALIAEVCTDMGGWTLFASRGPKMDKTLPESTYYIIKEE